MREIKVQFRKLPRLVLARLSRAGFALLRSVRQTEVDFGRFIFHVAQWVKA